VIKYYLISFFEGIIRTRFDVLSIGDGKPTDMGISFMNAFVNYMKLVQRNYKHLEISFFTSHSLNPEIESFSRQDAQFIVGPM